MRLFGENLESPKSNDYRSGDRKKHETLQDKWNEILQTVKRDYNICDVSFTTWIEPLTIHSV